VLAAAAVLGETFELPELGTVSGRDAETLEQTLDEATAAGLIEEIATGRHRFAHALTRDAVYAGLGASRRARLHRAAADAVAARHGLDPGPRLAEIALHRCAGAADGSDVDAAVELAERAAAWAFERDAYEQAVTLLTRALKLLTDADVERRRRITRSRALAFARLTHALFDS
jgi:predicted ATPase